VAARVPEPTVQAVEVEDITVSVGGSHPVDIRIYRPEHRAPGGAALVMVHGGGFVFGSLDSEEVVARAMSADLGVVVVSVGYRLAPDNPFPAPVLDCHTAWTWTVDNSPALGVSPDRLGLSGTSAGGCLATAIILLLQQRQETVPAFLLLETPVVDDRLATESMRAFEDTPIWNRPNAVVSWDSYLGPSMRGSAEVGALAAPARAESLAGFPPTFVTVCQFDPLRDEGVELAKRLLAEGTDVTLTHYRGAFHGASSLRSTRLARRMHADKVRALQLGLDLD